MPALYTFGRMGERLANRARSPQTAPGGTIAPRPAAPSPPTLLPPSGGNLEGIASIPEPPGGMSVSRGTSGTSGTPAPRGDFFGRVGAALKPKLDAKRAEQAGAAGAAPAAAPGATPAPTLPGQQFLSLYDAANEENIRNRYRQAGQYAARFGRLGSGMVQDDVDRIARDVERDRLGFAYGLYSDEFNRALAKANFTVQGKNQSAALTRALQEAEKARGSEASTADLLARYGYERSVNRPTG